jgi:pimeloyl-ACP methyl ester carboxylesterase
MSASTYTGTARAHDGSTLPFRVEGTGPRWLMAGLGVDPATWTAAFGDDFRLIVPDYATHLGEPKMYTLIPGAVARDYLALADAAGAERFVYYGYSWGAVAGLQLALWTDRLTALMSGGFPMLGGPYAEMLRATRAGEADPTRLAGIAMPWMPEVSRQFVTFYEGLRSFDDRATQGRPTCPRLNFAGSADDIDLDGELLARIGQTVANAKVELEGFGWDVTLLEGLDHAKAAAQDLVVPLVRDWLQRQMPGRA